MAVLDLFSHRKRVAQGEVPDVFVYDELPQALRVQIVHICQDAIGPYHHYSPIEFGGDVPENNDGWQFIHDLVAREHGVFELTSGRDPRQRCFDFLLGRDSVDEVLDLVEASFAYVDAVTRPLDQYQREKHGITVAATSAIAELNERFRRAGVGYAFEEGRIFRVDSELIHSEVVKPALRYLHHPGFDGPRQEFLNAHAHYRAGETKDAITDANNAFESTLKCICDQRRWEYSPGARASDLLNVVRTHELLPTYLDKSFDQLVATLKSGLPKVRSEEGAHGQGSVPHETPQYVAAYALHLAAAKILFLVEAHRATK